MINRNVATDDIADRMRLIIVEVFCKRNWASGETAPFRIGCD